MFLSVAAKGSGSGGDVLRCGMARHFKLGLWASSMSNAFKNSKLWFPPPVSVRLELPKQMAMRARQPLACRSVQSVARLQVVGGGQFECISPVIEVELFRLPSAPRSVYDDSRGSWMAQDVSEQAATPTVWRHGDEDGAVSVEFVVPRFVVVPDPKRPRVGWWHSEAAEWRVDDHGDDDDDDEEAVIGDVRFDAAKRVLSLTTRRLTALSMVQPIGSYSEYSEWRLTPSGVGRCKMRLQTACKVAVELEVVGGRCQLLEPKLPALHHLVHKLLSPHRLVSALRDCGVSLCGQSARSLSKADEIEDRAHREVSSVAALFELRMSSWNRAAEPNNEQLIVFRLRTQSGW